MKQLLVIALAFVVVNSQAQVISDTGSLRAFINANIVPNGNRQITAAMLNKILTGNINVLPGLLRPFVDSIWISGGNLFIRKGGVTNQQFINVTGNGGGPLNYISDSTRWQSSLKSISFTKGTGAYNLSFSTHSNTVTNLSANWLTLNDVLLTGNSSSVTPIVPSYAIQNTGSNFLGTISSTTLTANRNWEHPNKSGTYALLDDIPNTSLFATTSSVNAALQLKENSISAINATRRYWNGYKQFVVLNTDSTFEGSTNLYFTEARARAAVVPTTIDNLPMSGTLVWDVQNRNYASATITLTGNVSSFSITNALTNGIYILRVVQDNVGNRSISGWSSNIRWPSAISPSLTTSPNSIDVISFWFVNPNFNATYAYDFR
ncbi:MAG TPA: hypothetical protein DCQ29_00910 [Chitinophagaceae bacterium]|nr:hypothetical protein [Chitinophagaceae bacterium]